MYLIDGPDNGFMDKNTTHPIGEMNAITQNKSSLMFFLSEGQQAWSRGGVSLIVVVILHLWVGQWLMRQTESNLPPKPVVMEVTMLAPPVPVVKELPPPPAPPPPPEKIKPAQPKKPVVKPQVKIKKPVAPKVLALPKTPVVTKEEFTVPALPESIPEPSPPVVAPVKSVAPPKQNASNADAGEHSDSKTVVSGVVPLVRVPPKYPMRAVNRHIEGWVKIEFTISTTGSVVDPLVVAAEPDGIFDEAALSAISKWKFKEKVVNGKAVEQRAVQNLQFRLSTIN